MKKHTRKVVVTEEVYETVDGKIFSKREDAEEYERTLEQEKAFRTLPQRIADDSSPWTYCETEEEFDEVLKFWDKGRWIPTFPRPRFRGPDWYHPAETRLYSDFVMETLTERKKAFEVFLQAFAEPLTVVAWISKEDLERLSRSRFLKENVSEAAKGAVAEEMRKNGYWFCPSSDGDPAAYPVLSDGTVMVMSRKDWRGYLKEIYGDEKLPRKMPAVNEEFIR